MGGNVKSIPSSILQDSKSVRERESPFIEIANQLAARYLTAKYRKQGWEDGRISEVLAIQA